MTATGITISSEGVTAPTTQELYDAAIAGINAAAGGMLNTDAKTPQGQIATSIAAFASDSNARMIDLINGIDPRYSSGTLQDAIGKIYFLTRKPATPTSVTVQIIGNPGVIIPYGAFADDVNGNRYYCSGEATIGANGQAEAVFNAVQTGVIPCPANALNRIVSMVTGWDSINNEEAGIPGSEAESAVAFEARRRDSVAKNGRDSVGAIFGNVANIENVTDCFVAENYQGVPIELGETSYELAPHSVYVAVVGGDDVEIAKTIWGIKSLGCNTNGNTTVTVQDTSYSDPLLSYSIKFNRPDPVPVFFRVVVKNNGKLPSNYSALIKEAIAARFNGEDSQQSARERIGGTIYASSYYAGIASAVPGVQIKSVNIGNVSPAPSLELSLGIDQYPVIDAANITVLAE